VQQTFTHTRCSSSSFIVTLSLIRQTACARAQFSGCSSMTNAHSKTGQMAVCCQNLPLGGLSSRSTLFVLVGALFKKFGLFLNTPRTLATHTSISTSTQCTSRDHHHNRQQFLSPKHKYYSEDIVLVEYTGCMPSDITQR
jgi:hypothetical protein